MCFFVTLNKLCIVYVKILRSITITDFGFVFLQIGYRPLRTPEYLATRRWKFTLEMIRSGPMALTLAAPRPAADSHNVTLKVSPVTPTT